MLNAESLIQDEREEGGKRQYADTACLHQDKNDHLSLQGEKGAGVCHRQTGNAGGTGSREEGIQQWHAQSISSHLRQRQ